MIRGRVVSLITTTTTTSTYPSSPLPLSTPGKFMTRCCLFCMLWLVTDYMHVYSLRIFDCTDVMALYSAHVSFVFLLSWVILHDQFVGVRLQRDCYLDAATTKGLARCSHNEIVASMQPQRACSFDVATTRLLPRCSHNESYNEGFGSMQPQRDCCLDAAKSLRLRCSYNEIVASMQPQRRVWLDAATTRLLPRCSQN
ncbi:hypothetical protein O3P69_019100 [Scylla paramamosain]|uniref:Uncharacterized protein n=1 Tax=Scylla paramamosain TaxID=85552 RepID=A0AAW0SA27_SCYPA